MKKIICLLIFVFSFMLYGADCYGAEIEKDIGVNAKTEVIVEGAKEGVKVDDNEIKVELDDGTIIIAEGNFEEKIRLMVMPIRKSMKKEWDWLQNMTKKIGINKSAYDIFFVNSLGVRVDAGSGSKISVMSRDRLKDISVYFIESNGVQSKLKSKIEEYVVKFRMVKNGYYTLVIANNTSAELNKDDDSIKDVTDIGNNTDKDSNDNKGNKGNENKGNDDEDDSNGDEKIDGVKLDGSQDTDNEDDEKEKSSIFTFIVIGIFLITVIIIIIILLKMKKDEQDNSEDI